MAKRESVQKRLEKVRPPRVQLTYDVEIGNVIEKKEIPFVAGVMGDFAGTQNPEKPPAKLRERKFVSVDLGSLDEVMQGMAPAASYRVKNQLTVDGGEFVVNLRFSRMDDFRPESVVQQVEPLRKLLEVRNKLADLRNKMAGNERLEDVLVDVLRNPAQLSALGQEATEDAA